MTNYAEGDVIVLKAASWVLLNGSNLQQIETDLECVVESTSKFNAGSEDDHFESGIMVRARKLSAGGVYDRTAPIYTFAASGDFDAKYIQPALPVLRKMRKTFVAVPGAGPSPATEEKVPPAQPANLVKPAAKQETKAAPAKQAEPKK